MPTKKPFSYQRKFLDWGRGRKRVGIFFRMRLGKTFTSILWTKRELGVRKRANVLTVAPNPVIPGWEDELADHVDRVVTLQGTRLERGTLLEENFGQKGLNWFCINPEGLRAMPEIAWMPWDAVLIDESTVIRKPKAQITKLCTRAFLGVEVKALLSGLPNPEGPADFFTQMMFLRDGTFMGCSNYWAWRARNFISVGYDWVPRRGMKDKVALDLAQDCYFLSEKDAGLKMRKVYAKRYVELPASTRGIYRRATRDFELGQAMAKWTVQVQTWLQQIAGGIIPEDFSRSRNFFTDHKLRELEYVLQGELRDRRVVVFFRFIRELKLVRDRLRKRGLQVETLFGANSRAHRAKVIRNFRDSKIPIVLCQGKLARFGLDFSPASALIFYSNEWDYETRDQCEARGLHPKKKEPTLILDIVTRGTTDENVVQALREKRVGTMDIVRRVKQLYVESQKKAA